MTLPPVVRTATRHAVLLAACLPATGCGAGWQAVPAPWPTALPPRQQVQLWTGSEAARLHGVVITGDSISGVPYLRPLSCDSCRVGFPRPAIDSLRIGDPSAGLLASIGLALLSVVLVSVAACEMGAPACPLSGGT